MMVTTSHVASVHLGLEASVAAGDSWPGALSSPRCFWPLFYPTSAAANNFAPLAKSTYRLYGRRLLEEMTSLEVVQQWWEFWVNIRGEGLLSTNTMQQN